MKDHSILDVSFLNLPIFQRTHQDIEDDGPVLAIVEKGDPIQFYLTLNDQEFDSKVSSRVLTKSYDPSVDKDMMKRFEVNLQATTLDDELIHELCISNCPKPNSRTNQHLHIPHFNKLKPVAGRVFTIGLQLLSPSKAKCLKVIPNLYLLLISSTEKKKFARHLKPQPFSHQFDLMEDDCSFKKVNLLLGFTSNNDFNTKIAAGLVETYSDADDEEEEEEGTKSVGTSCSHSNQYIYVTLEEVLLTYLKVKRIDSNNRIKIKKKNPTPRVRMKIWMMFTRASKMKAPRTKAAKKYNKARIFHHHHLNSN